VVCALILLGLAWRIGYFNRLETQKNLGNSPPKLAGHIPDLSIPAGVTSHFTVSEQPFIDPDLGDALRFHAHCLSGGKLPKWIVFDRFSRTFSFTPPEHSSGTEEIKIVAVDFEGAAVSGKMVVHYGMHSPQGA
jgi:hypothetical protein